MKDKKLKNINCPMCYGAGTTWDDYTCEVCDGIGNIAKPKYIEDYIELCISPSGEGSWHDCTDYLGGVIQKAKKLYRPIENERE